MLEGFASTRVSFVPRKRSSYVKARTTPAELEQRNSLAYNNSTQSVYSSPKTDSTMLTNNGVYSIAKNSSQKNPMLYSNKTQRFLPNQNKFDHPTNTKNEQRMLYNYKQFSCKQKCIVFLSILLAFLILVAFVLPYVLIYFLSQNVTFLTQLTQTVISEVSSDKYYCAGISAWSQWTGVTGFNATIGMTIDTSSCQFNSTPLYFTSVGGNNDQFSIASYTAIYFATNKSFTIFANSLSGANGIQMLNDAVSNQWNVNWLGVTY